LLRSLYFLLLLLLIIINYTILRARARARNQFLQIFIHTPLKRCFYWLWLLLY